MTFNANEFFNNLENTGNSAEEQSQIEQSGIEEQEQQDVQDVVQEGEDTQNTEGVQSEDTLEQTKKLAGIYDSVEDLEEGYKNLQREFTRLKQQMKQKSVEDIANTMPQQNIAQQYQGTPQQSNPVIPPELANNPQFIQLAQTNPQQALAAVMEYNKRLAVQQYQQTAQQKMQAQIELLTLKSSVNDFDDVAPYMAQTLQENPWLWNTPEPIKAAYQLAKATMFEQGVAQVTNAVGEQAQKATQSKKAAVAERQTAKQQPKQKTPEEEIVEDIMNAGGVRNSIFF